MGGWGNLRWNMVLGMSKMDTGQPQGMKGRDWPLSQDRQWERLERKEDERLTSKGILKEQSKSAKARMNVRERRNKKNF